jgi:hypothetical protein
MNKIFRIVQYVQPWEIDDLDRQADQLIRGSYYIEPEDSVIIDVTMNTQIVNWAESKLPIEYFLGKFKCIESKLKNYFITEFDTDINIHGCTDKRRNCNSKSQDYIIWLDSDVYFPSNLLPLMIAGSKQLNDTAYILTPQIIKYWDHSWDCITNELFLSEPLNHRDMFDLYSIDALTSHKQIQILKNNQIKFGGGWFNLFKTELFDQIPLVNELGAYAPDDTYISYCGMQINMPQYIMSGTIVSEIGKRFLVDKDYIKKMLTINIEDKVKITDQELSRLIHEYSLTLQTN